MTIILDTREPDDLEVALQKKGVTVQRQELLVGDIVFYDWCLERKTATDFFTSTVSGAHRIWRQAFDGKENYPKYAIVIVGPRLISPSLLAKMNTTQMIARKNMIATEAALSCLGIHVKHVDDQDEYVDLIYHIYLKSDPNAGSARPIAPKLHKPSAQEIREDMLTRVPRIGLKTAENILASFPTIEALCQASVEDLDRIPMVTVEKAKALLEVLKGEQKTQNTSSAQLSETT